MWWYALSAKQVYDCILCNILRLSHVIIHIPFFVLRHVNILLILFFLFICSNALTKMCLYALKFLKALTLLWVVTGWHLSVHNLICSLLRMVTICCESQINDRYEFPLQLDLDRDNGKYLSPDADRNVRNLYTLHRSGRYLSNDFLFTCLH